MKRKVIFLWVSWKWSEVKLAQLPAPSNKLKFICIARWLVIGLTPSCLHSLSLPLTLISLINKDQLIQQQTKNNQTSFHEFNAMSEMIGLIWFLWNDWFVKGIELICLMEWGWRSSRHSIQSKSTNSLSLVGFICWRKGYGVPPPTGRERVEWERWEWSKEKNWLSESWQHNP